MRAVVTNYGTLPNKSDAIPEDLKPFAQQVLKMDAIKDVPGNVTAIGGHRPIKLKATALPPEMQREVYQKLSDMPRMSDADRAKYEDQFVAAAIRSKQGAIRGQTGVGRDALPFHREQAEIAMQVDTLLRKREEYREQMDWIVDLKKSTDPQTGELVAEPEHWLSPVKRENFQNVIHDIDRQIRLLVGDDGSFGIEGQKRMQAALLESASILRNRNAAQAEEAEAKQRAADMLRDERINKRAEAYARMQRGNQ